MASAILEVKEITKKFAGLVAVDKVSLSLEEHGIYGLIGPNGSGKTTLFNVITGFLKSDGGSIFYSGTEITSAHPKQIVNMGLIRTFQLTRLFAKMTVLENLLVGCPFGTGEATGKAQEALRLVGLEGMEEERAKNLSYGQRKALEFSRSLMMNPKLILLDEPMAGLPESMVTNMSDYIRVARSEGKTILIIEHNVAAVMCLCEKIFVLDHGRKIFEGVPSEVLACEKVKEAYFGD